MLIAVTLILLGYITLRSALVLLNKHILLKNYSWIEYSVLCLYIFYLAVFFFRGQDVFRSSVVPLEALYALFYVSLVFLGIGISALTSKKDEEVFSQSIFFHLSLVFIFLLIAVVETSKTNLLVATTWEKILVCLLAITAGFLLRWTTDFRAIEKRIFLIVFVCITMCTLFLILESNSFPLLTTAFLLISSVNLLKELGLTMLTHIQKHDTSPDLIKEAYISEVTETVLITSEDRPEEDKTISLNALKK